MTKYIFKSLQIKDKNKDKTVVLDRWLGTNNDEKVAGVKKQWL